MPQIIPTGDVMDGFDSLQAMKKAWPVSCENGCRHVQKNPFLYGFCGDEQLR